ncbi:MAG: hypothetical protein PWP23_3285 [Candidatus Sumerlaeota bacterium]|nr:hypothetical protein [Candidatus Sumerlaeota bacterium]
MWVPFPADQHAAPLLQPGEQAFDSPSFSVSVKGPATSRDRPGEQTHPHEVWNAGALVSAAISTFPHYRRDEDEPENKRAMQAGRQEPGTEDRELKTPSPFLRLPMASVPSRKLAWINCQAKGVRREDSLPHLSGRDRSLGEGLLPELRFAAQRGGHGGELLLAWSGYPENAGDKGTRALAVEETAWKGVLEQALAAHAGGTPLPPGDEAEHPSVRRRRPRVEAWLRAAH